MLPSGYTAKALALAGLRDFDGANDALDEAFERAKRSMDNYAQQNAYSCRMRVLAQERRFSDACAIEPPTLKGALPSMQGEVNASRGLVLACLGRVLEAKASADLARRVTRGLEASTLADSIECVLAVEGGRPDARELAEKLVDRAFGSGAVDILVTCYRSSPAVLSLLLRLPSTSERVMYAVKRAADDGLAEPHGSLSTMLDPANALSGREREICDFVAEGLSNRDIAGLLFISEATVKAHVHRVFEKLGVHTRQALVIRAMKARESQAASIATGATSPSSSDL